MAFGSKRGSMPQRNPGASRNAAPKAGGQGGKRRFPWVAAAVAAAVIAAVVFGAAAMTAGSGSQDGQEAPKAAETVDSSRIAGADSLTFLDDAAKARFAAAAKDFLTEQGYAWPCTVTIVGDAEQYETGGTKFYFLTGEGKAWTVLYSPTAASEFSISELNTTVKGVNDEATVAEGGDSSSSSTTAPKGSGYTSEDDGPAIVDARPSSSSASSGSSHSGSGSQKTQDIASKTPQSDSGSQSASDGGRSDNGSSSTQSVERIAAGTVAVTDEDAMEAFLPRDATTVFPQAVKQYLAKWGISASKARACNGSAQKSGSRHSFNMTAGSHAATVSYDASTHKFSFKTLY